MLRWLRSSLPARAGLAVILIAMLLALLVGGFILPLPDYRPAAQAIKLVSAASMVSGTFKLSELEG